MCMEDIVIGRQKRSALTVLQVGAAAGIPLLTTDWNRTGFLVNSTAGQAFNISNEPMTGNNQGMRIDTTNGGTVYFDVEQYGDFVRKPLFAWNAGAAQALVVITITLDRQD